MNSMTGFGKAEVKCKLGSFSVEMSSVNNRFLEVSLRVSRAFASVEPKIRELLSKKLERGKVTIFINFDDTSSVDAKPYINASAAKQIFKQLEKLQKDLKLPGELSINDLLMHPDIVKPAYSDYDEKKYLPHIVKAVDTAVDSLIKMRKKEGMILSKDMNKRVSLLAKEIKKIEKESAKVIANYRERLNRRIGELLEKPVGDSKRIEEEITIMAERTDITEECIRFSSHLEQFTSTINKNNRAVGKKLNFILQELNREANTIASKCADIKISAKSIILKEEIEKLREQVQNIE